MTEKRVKHGTRSASGSGSLWWGIALVAVGALLMIERFSLMDLGPLFRFWPLVLVVIGAVAFARAEDVSGRRTGSWLALVGGWMLVSNLGWLGFSWGDSWPLLVIGAGAIDLVLPKPGEGRADGLTPFFIGLWMLVSVHGYWGLTWATSWPLVLIAVGLAITGKAVLEQWSGPDGGER